MVNAIAASVAMLPTDQQYFEINFAIKYFAKAFQKQISIFSFYAVRYEKDVPIFFCISGAKYRRNKIS